MKIQYALLVAIILAGAVHADPHQANLHHLATANNEFTFKLLRQVTAEQPRQNIFISPYSVATTLQMVANGAKGQTKSELANALGTSGLAASVVNKESRAAQALLNFKDTNVALTAANAVWYRKGTPPNPNFIAENKEFYSSIFKPVDFRNASAAEAEINKWASDQTHGRITDIASGMVDSSYTDMILANAIYFKARWQNPFEKTFTKERLFHPADGAAKNVPMMSIGGRFGYRKGSGYQAVCILYAGEQLGMYVFLPDPGSSPSELLRIMNGNTWRNVTFPEQPGSIILPKFKMENMLGLKETLKSVGIRAAFEPTNADFSKIFGNQHYISDVGQKAFVEVNEDGTEAAAVTVMAEESSGIEPHPEKPFVMIMDRPFMFFIVQKPSKMILFAGVANAL